MVPMMDAAIDEVSKADIFIVVGTSLLVYPAAGLVDYVRYDVPVYVIDPKIPQLYNCPNAIRISEKASAGLSKVKGVLVEKYHK
jgi:NAD-dependent deacetylase